MPSSRNRRRAVSWRAAFIALSMAIGVVVALTGVGQGLDLALRETRDRFHRHPASGEIVVVEIDARSLQAAQRWPWPRSRFADFVDRARDAGVRTLAFDVDFSGRSEPGQDQALAEALRRFGGGAILPTFRQRSGSKSHDFVESLPIPVLRDAAFLGSVNVHPGRDGMMRFYPYGELTGGVPRPSLAALLGERSGAVGDQFLIDYAISPDTIPRVSFQDVLEKRVGAEALKGKRVVVGATAIELGDRYATPGYGVLPGVVIQALAAETLFQKADLPNLGPWPLFLVVVAGGLISAATRNRLRQAAALAAILVIVVGAPLVLETAHLATMETAPALAVILAAIVRQSVSAVLAKVSRTRLSDAESGLPNTQALIETYRGQTRSLVLAVRFNRFDEACSVLSETERRALVAAIVERLRTSTGGARIHRGGRDLFLWVVSEEEAQVLEPTVFALAALFRTPMYLESRSLVLKPGFGVARCAADAALDADLVAKAELAAAQAVAGGEILREHDEALGRKADEAVSLLADVERALAERQFWVAYQPKVDLAADRIVGAEALVRWDHPTKGPLSPGVFVPLLEAEGHAADLTLFVLSRVLEDMTAWGERGHHPGVAFNVSATLLGDAAFAEAVVARVAAAGLEPSRVTVEVTESAAVSNADAAIATLERFRAAGLRISVDDYGTGQSTLTYLKRFPAHEIKIDQSFVRNLVSERHDQVLVRSTIGLAHELGLKVVAEGIEDVETLALLREMACDTGQGWALGRPARPDDFIAAFAAAPVAADRPAAA